MQLQHVSRPAAHIGDTFPIAGEAKYCLGERLSIARLNDNATAVLMDQLRDLSVFC